MVSFTYTVKSEMGLHARPAGIMVKRLQDEPADVTVRCGQRVANGKKLFQLMAMGVKCGETVAVEISGQNEETLCKELQQFFAKNY